MPVIQELEEFVRIHQPCEGMAGDATIPTVEGYLVWVACQCGERFERWVTPEAADEELESWARHRRN